MIKLNIIKNRKFSIILIILLLVFFSWGFLSATYKTFPFNIVRNIYWKFATTNPPLIMDNEKISYITKFYTNKEFINYQKNILLKKFKNIKKDSNLFRKKIIDKYILPNKLVKFSKSEINEILNKKTLIHLQHHKFQNKPPKDSILLKVKYYNINHFGVLETNQNNKKLLIYHQGHGGNPYNFEYFLYLKEKFKSKGYDVLSLSMSGLGYNFLGNTNYSFPINAEKNSEVSFNYTFGSRQLLDHYIYRHYYDNNYPNIMPHALMLSGNYYLIKNLENNYDEIVMIGISGGGLATSMLAGLIPKINKSYNFHSLLPKIFRLNREGDWEESYSNIWDEYSYWDFYFLALLDSENFQNREHHIIHNLERTRPGGPLGGENVLYAFNNPFAKMFKNLVDFTAIDKLSVIVLDKTPHEIDIKFLENYILKKLD